MKILSLFLTLLAIIVLTSLFGVQGQFQEQYVTPSSGYSTAAQSAAQNPSQYTQFYAMTTAPSDGNPIGAPQQSEIAGNMPSTVTGTNSLWIKGISNWTQYAVVPQGATVSLFAISPSGGNGPLTFVDSNGQTYSNNYNFYQNSIFTFYTYTIGRHILSFAIDGQSSNQVVIDAVGNCAQPSNYPGYCSLSDYYSGECEIYPWNTYLWHYYEHIGLL